jgi:hypothetical protein
MIKLLMLFFMAFVIYWVVRFFFAARSFKKSAREFPGFNGKKGVSEGDTVKCEKCTSYVASELSLSASDKGRTVYFCSDECKRAFFDKG